MIESFGPLAIFFIVAAIFPVVPLILAQFIAPKRPNSVKLQPYESGVETIGPTHVQFRTRYYLYALMFVIFDVETIFLFPWAVRLRWFRALDPGLAPLVLIEVGIFIAILALGLVYAWRKGVLEWT